MTIPQTQQGSLNPAGGPVIGVLLVHGFNGNTNDMIEVEEYLQAHGMITVNMLLPGHGMRDVRDLMLLGWDDWAQAVRGELCQLKERCDMVFLVGHSMGGSLALHIAAHEEVAGVIVMCAPIFMHPLLKPLISTMKFVTPMLPTIFEDVRDREARRRYKRGNYRWTPVRPIESMLKFLPQLRAELPQVAAPALIMMSLHDHVVPPRDGREIYHRIGSQEKYLVTFHHSYHIVMKDHDRDEVLSKTGAFILRQVAKMKPNQQFSSTNQTA
jgi:carboxylesterase